MTVTGSPSRTGFGDADNDTDGLSSSTIVIVTDDGDPIEYPVGAPVIVTVNDSSS
ncbi:MAG: hypothetical protein OXB99_10900 [Acidimicrobiaceae bacterium]|nr:hypothetical protein [Acidimicrobiaceae bacterium]